MKAYFKILIIIVCQCALVSRVYSQTKPPHCGTDEAYRQRLIENPEVLKNKNSQAPKVDTIINAREEELKKIYYDKLKLQKTKNDLSQQPKDTIY